MTHVSASRPHVSSRPTGPTPASAGGGGPAPTLDLAKILRKHKVTLMTAAIAGCVLGAGLHFVLASFYPIYSVRMIYEAFARKNDLSGEPVGNEREEMEQFMATEVLAIKSDRLVRDTALDPKLQSEAPAWYARHTKKGVYDATESAKNISDNLSAGVQGDSKFFQVSFWWTKPEDTAGVMNVLAQNYEAYRRQTTNIGSSEKKQSLSSAIASNENQIATLKEQKKGITSSLGVDTVEEAQAPILRTIEDLESQNVDAGSQLEQYRANLKQMNDMMTGPNPLVVDDDIRDEVEREQSVQWHKQYLNQLESELQAKLQRLPRTHREVQQLEDRADAARNQLEKIRQEQALKVFEARRNRLSNAIGGLEAMIAGNMKKLEAARLRATDLANARSQIQNLGERIKNYEDDTAKLRSQLTQINAMENEVSFRRVAMQDGPRVPTEMSFPKLEFLLPAGLILSLGTVGGLIMLRELMDQRVKGASDISMIGRTRVLGVIPDPSEDPTSPTRLETVFRDQPTGVLTESFRQVRATLVKQMQANGRKSVLIASGMPGPEGTNVAMNLAFALAAGECRVLLIDANFRRPTIARVLGLSEGPGLGEVLAGERPLEQAVQETGTAHLWALAAGAPAARRVERLSGDAMARLMTQAKERYDYIVVDAPPTVVAGDALSTAQHCDSSLLVVKAMSDKRGLVARLRNELTETHAEFLGVVITGVRSSVGGYMRQNIAAQREYHNGEHKA
jgi:polysaccharide biosynthesis transport protein